MKKRIRTNRMRYILISGLIVVGLGIGISCSKDTGISSTEPGPRATKPAIMDPSSADFHPQTGVNYDPFAGMNEEDRKAAIGGRDAGEKYFQIITERLANAMNDDGARAILHNVVPKSDEGEIHLAQIATEHPAFLNVLANGFKDAVGGKSIEGMLADEVKNTASNAESILKASKALCDLVLMVVVPDGDGWDVSKKIPVFYMPLDDESVATVMNGANSDLKAITLPYPVPKVTYPFLLLNIDESSPMLDGNAGLINLTMVPTEKRVWSKFLKSFSSLSLVSPAYGHDYAVTHGPHYYLIQPVREITIYDTHEGSTKPDIKMQVFIMIKDNPDNDDWIYTEGPYDLRDVDEINVPYTDYEDITTTHGTAQYPNGNYIRQIRVYETDGLWNKDDEVCRWSDIPIYTPGTSKFLSRWQGDVGHAENGQPLHRDADLWIKKLQ